MSRHLFLIIGNGFSIDFLNYIKKTDEIDVSNLFRYGSSVPWPADGEPGFLSYKHCPHLWNLGARPNMKFEAAMGLIEEIITCVNVYVSTPATSRKRRENRPNDIYIFAYKELSAYLKHLFIYYDRKVPAIPDAIDEWSWSKFLTHIANSTSYDTVTIVTYNYDIWLERVLQKLGLPFNISLIGTQVSTKINILKPHGSISFAHNRVLDKEAFVIPFDHELADGAAEDFAVRYDELDNNYLVSALIPPAGESGRFNHTWAGQIRQRVKETVSTLRSSDEVIVCGISYWHVDRAELDEILVGCDPSVNMKMINPSPQTSFNAVMTSIFDNYIFYTSASVLEDLIL